MLNADAVATADDGPAPCAAAGASGSAHGHPEFDKGRTLVGGRPAYRPTLAAAAALVAPAAARVAASSRLRRRLVGATLPDSRDRTPPRADRL